MDEFLDVGLATPTYDSDYDYEMGLESNPYYKLTLIGDCDTGKTSAMSRICGKEFSRSYIPTIGIEFARYCLELDDAPLTAQMWDTSGDKRYRPIIESFYRGADGFIIFYDVTRQETFDNVAYWLEETKKYGYPEAKVMVVGAKSDLNDNKVVAYETAKDFADENNVLLFEVSSKDKTSIELALMTIFTVIHAAKQQRDSALMYCSAP